MNASGHSKKSILPIAIAEGGSTIVSLGALWVVERSEKLLAPIQNAVADHLYASSINTAYPSTQEQQVKAAKAHKDASVLVKGAAMIGTGFAAHLPMQLALERRLDMKSFRTAAMGKGVGVATSLGAIVLLNQVTPEFMPKVQEMLAPIIRPFIPKDQREGGESNDEVAKLLILDLTSSAIAGLVNYSFSHKLR